MVSRKNVAGVFVFVLLIGLLAGCVATPAELPDREVEVSMEQALAAQQKGMEGLATGEATLSEAELSSFATALIQQYGGGAVPVEAVKVWTDDGQLALQAMLTEGTVPGISTIDLVGDIMVEDGRVKVALTQAGAGPISAQGPVLGLVEGMINRALDDPSLGVAIGVDVGEDGVTISLGQ